MNGFGEALAGALIFVLVIALVVGAALGVGCVYGFGWIAHHVSLSVHS